MAKYFFFASVCVSVYLIKKNLNFDILSILKEIELYKYEIAPNEEKILLKNIWAQKIIWSFLALYFVKEIVFKLKLSINRVYIQIYPRRFGKSICLNICSVKDKLKKNKEKRRVVRFPCHVWHAISFNLKPKRRIETKTLKYEKLHETQRSLEGGQTWALDAWQAPPLSVLILQNFWLKNL